MGVLSWISRRSAGAPRPFDEVITRLDGMMGRSRSGPAVSTTTALQVSTVLACVKAIADGCATPSLNVFRETKDGGRELARNIPEFRILNRRPNEWQTSFEFRRTMTMHAALTGNALAVKVMSGNRIRELIPIQPGRFTIERIARYEVIYRVYDEWGLIGVFGPEEVFHLPCWQWDAIKGLDAVQMARDAIGLAMAAEESQASLHSNGGRPVGLLSTDQKVSEEIVTRVKEGWRKFTNGDRNGTAVLDNGWKYSPLAMSGVDAQHIETRRFQVEEICRAFGVFPIMIGHSDKAATFASSEAFFAGHVKHTLAPWHQLWTQRLDEFVLDGAGPLFAEFDTRYLLSGSMKDRAVWARTMAEMGIYTRNEIRDEEGKDPLPGLDEPLTPMNMGGSPTSGGSQDDPSAP